MPQFNKNKIKKLRIIDRLLKAVYFYPKNKQHIMPPIKSVDVKNILIPSFFLIGDSIMYLPSFLAIRKNYPNANIIILCSKTLKDVLGNVNLIDKFIIVNCPWIAPFDKSIKNIVNFFKQIIQINKQENIDLIIDFRGDWRTIFMMNFIRSKRKVSYNTTGGDYMLTDPIIPNPNIHHYTEEGLYLLQSIGLNLSDIPKSPELKLSSEYLTEIKKFRKEHNIEDKIVIGIHPGVSASKEARMWEESKFAELIISINKHNNDIDHFVLFEGPNEKETIDQITAITRSNDKIKTIIIKEKLTEYIKLLNVCDIIICNDSGAGHLACAFSIPTIIIFGKADPRAVKPYSDYANIISHDLSCKPCNQHVCPLGTNDCIKHISSEEVYSEAQSLINNIRK